MERLGDDGRALAIAEVESELRELWRQAGSKETSRIRACTLNLVVVCEGQDALSEASAAVASVSEHHPGRALVVSVDPEQNGRSGLVAYVSAHCHLASGGRQICSEQVTLRAAGTGADLVPETLLHLLCGDLPVYVWWRRPRLENDRLARRLARLADRFIGDSGRADDPAAALAALADLARDAPGRCGVADLQWGRLESLREMVASLFDSPLTRPHLERATALRIVAGGVPGPEALTPAGAYVAGWLASRLGWEPGGGARRWRRQDGADLRIALGHDPRLGPGQVASLRLDSGDANPPACFVAERLPGAEEVFRIAVEMERTCPLPRVLHVPPREEAALLCDEMDRRGRDPVYEAALGRAARLARGESSPGA